MAIDSTCSRRTISNEDHGPLPGLSERHLKEMLSIFDEVQENASPESEWALAWLDQLRTVASPLPAAISGSARHRADILAVAQAIASLPVNVRAIVAEEFRRHIEVNAQDNDDRPPLRPSAGSMSPQCPLPLLESIGDARVIVRGVPALGPLSGVLLAGPRRATLLIAGPSPSDQRTTAHLLAHLLLEHVDRWRFGLWLEYTAGQSPLGSLRGIARRHAERQADMATACILQEHGDNAASLSVRRRLILAMLELAVPGWVSRCLGAAAPTAPTEHLGPLPPAIALNARSLAFCSAIGAPEAGPGTGADATLEYQNERRQLLSLARRRDLSMEYKRMVLARRGIRAEKIDVVLSAPYSMEAEAILYNSVRVVGYMEPQSAGSAKAMMQSELKRARLEALAAWEQNMRGAVQQRRAGSGLR